MTALPTLEAGDNECLALATELKGVLQDAQIWTKTYEAVFQDAVATVIKPTAASLTAQLPPEVSQTTGASEQV